MRTLFKFCSPAAVVAAARRGLRCWGGWCFWRSAVYRQRFLAECASGRDASPGAVVRAAVAAVRASMVAELPRLWLGAAPRAVTRGGHGTLWRPRCGKGGVMSVLTPHLGCFESQAQAYAQRYGGRTWPHDGAVSPATPSPGCASDGAPRAAALACRLAPTTLAGVKQMIKALKRGECRGLAARPGAACRAWACGRRSLGATPTP